MRGLHVLCVFCLWGWWELTSCATFIGIADKHSALADWATIAEFCYVIPKGKTGDLDAILNTDYPGHRLAMIRNEVLSRILKTHKQGPSLPKDERRLSPEPLEKETTSNHDTAFSFTGPPLNARLGVHHTRRASSETDKMTQCEAIGQAADSSQDLSSSKKWHEITEQISSDMNLVPFKVLVTSCGNQVQAQYIIKLTNPGGLFSRHFGCEDQGILQLFFALAAIQVIASILSHSRWKSLMKDRENHHVATLAYVGCMSCTASKVLVLLHLLIYAFDGLGLKIFAFLASLQHLIFLMAMSCVITTALTSPEVQRNNKKTPPIFLFDSQDASVVIRRYIPNWSHLRKVIEMTTRPSTLIGLIGLFGTTSMIFRCAEDLQIKKLYVDANQVFLLRPLVFDASESKLSTILLYMLYIVRCKLAGVVASRTKIHTKNRGFLLRALFWTCLPLWMLCLRPLNYLIHIPRSFWSKYLYLLISCTSELILIHSLLVSLESIEVDEARPSPRPSFEVATLIGAESPELTRK